MLAAAWIDTRSLGLAARGSAWPSGPVAWKHLISARSMVSGARIKTGPQAPFSPYPVTNNAH